VSKYEKYQHKSACSLGTTSSFSYSKHKVNKIHVLKLGFYLIHKHHGCRVHRSTISRC